MTHRGAFYTNPNAYDIIFRELYAHTVPRAVEMNTKSRLKCSGSKVGQILKMSLSVEGYWHSRWRTAQRIGLLRRKKCTNPTMRLRFNRRKHSGDRLRFYVGASLTLSVNVCVTSRVKGPLEPSRASPGARAGVAGRAGVGQEAVEALQLACRPRGRPCARCGACLCFRPRLTRENHPGK